MTTKQQIKAPMYAAKVSLDSGASQGTRRASEDAPESTPTMPPPANNTEVVPRARRRTFTKADKRRILQCGSTVHQTRRDRRADAPRGRLLVLPEHLAPPA